MRKISIGCSSALKKSLPSQESAKSVEKAHLGDCGLHTGGDTAGLLMARVKTAIEGKEPDLAIKLLTAIIDIRPDYVEAWNRRATLLLHEEGFRLGAGGYPRGAGSASHAISARWPASE